MTTTAPYGLSVEENAEIDAIFDNEDLMAFMSSGISNSGEKEPEETLMQRAEASIKSFATYSPSWWKKKE